MFWYNNEVFHSSQSRIVTNNSIEFCFSKPSLAVTCTWVCDECISSRGVCIALQHSCIASFVLVIGEKIRGSKPWDWADAIWIGNVTSLWWVQVQDETVCTLRTCSCAWRLIFNLEHRMSSQIWTCILARKTILQNYFSQLYKIVGSRSCCRIQCSMEHTVEAIQQWLQRPLKTAS